MAPSLARAAGPPPLERPQDTPAQPAAATEPAQPAQEAEPTRRVHHAHFRPVRASWQAQASNGMVRYQKPIFHNGRLVLWHGAWRNGGAATAAAKPAGPDSNPTAVAKPGNFMILADSADASATRMAVELANALQSGGLHAQTVLGKTSAAALAKAVSGDSADFAIVPTDGLIDQAKDNGAADLRQRLPYVVRLPSEPIEVIAPRAVTDISQLAGRKVGVGAEGGGAAASAGIVFSRLNIAPTIINEELPEALSNLAQGLIDAVFVVGGEDSKALADFGKDGRFHVLSIAYAPALQPLYYPMRLTAREQPNLIGGDEKIETIGVKTALVAIDAAPHTPRAERLAPLANALFAKFDQLAGATDNADWRDVNLAEKIAGWPRFDGARVWLEQNAGGASPALEAFRNMAQTATGASEGPTAADSDRLYENLMQWGGAGQ